MTWKKVHIYINTGTTKKYGITFAYKIIEKIIASFV